MPRGWQVQRIDADEREHEGAEQLSAFDVAVAVVMGLVGYVMLRFGYSVAAASFGVILRPQLESSLREGLLLEDGNFLHLISRPITPIVVVLAARSLAYGVRAEIRARRVDKGKAAAS